MSNLEPYWEEVWSEVPRGLGLSAIFMADSDNGFRCALSTFAGDTKLVGVADTLGGLGHRDPE